jgi:DNA polymerase-3 subunit epsilon
MSTFQWIGKSADGNTITLKRLDIETMFQFPNYVTPEWIEANRESIRTGAVLDVETTGLSQDTDQIIEIGIRQFLFNRETGEILSLNAAYSAFQDPGVPLSPEITVLTGITDEMVKGQHINWDQVESILSTSNIVIAHNASFDRPFIDAKSPISNEKIWACSLKQVDWSAKGLPSQKLDVLSIYHGFFNGSHRALNDADSLLYLLSQHDQKLKSPYFFELLNEARKPMVIMHANFAPFEVKDALRDRKYRWNAQAKVWSKRLPKEDLRDETEWLTQEVYRGNFRGQVEEISAKDQFKTKS